MSCLLLLSVDIYYNITLLQTVHEELMQAAEDLESVRRTGLVKSFHNNNNPLAAKHQNLTGLSSTYQQRLQSTQVCVYLYESHSLISYIIFTVHFYYILTYVYIHVY